MNALINAINEKTKIILENDGRLLKKSFFGLLLLSLVFQGGEFGEVIRSSMIDAYIQVSVFVGFTLFVFIGCGLCNTQAFSNINDTSLTFGI